MPVVTGSAQGEIIASATGYTSASKILIYPMQIPIKGPWGHDETTLFLAESTYPVRLAAVASDGFPRVVSLWYRSRVLTLECVTHRDAPLVKLLAANANVGFEISPNDPPYHGVRGQGIATISPLAESDTLDWMVSHYLGDSDSQVGRWLLSRREQEVVIKIEPQRLFSWDYRERMADVSS